MKIKAIRVHKKNLGLTRPYTITFKTVTSVENVLVEIELENGIIGLGTANPSKQVVGEDVQETFQNLQHPVIQSFVGSNIANIFSIIETVKNTFPHKPGAMAAMDIALHDAFCQYLGVPIAQFYGQKIKKMPTSVTIGIKNVADTLEEAKEYYERDFKVLKVKTGLNYEEDIERLVKIKETYSNKMKIRVDANQGYTAEQVKDFYKRTQSLKLELIEQPMPMGAEKEVRRLPASIRKRLAADESLHDAKAAFELAAQKTFGIFNIKLMKCGGIAGGLEIANVAKNAGIDLFWGCNDESIVSITAALHAAFACPNTKYIDLDGSLDLAEDVVKSGFILKNGIMQLSGKSGLGLTL